jgi:hypothetical protein
VDHFTRWSLEGVLLALDGLNAWQANPQEGTASLDQMLLGLSFTLPDGHYDPRGVSQLVQGLATVAQHALQMVANMSGDPEGGVQLVLAEMRELAEDDLREGTAGGR